MYRSQLTTTTTAPKTTNIRLLPLTTTNTHTLFIFMKSSIPPLIINIIPKHIKLMRIHRKCTNIETTCYFSMSWHYSSIGGTHNIVYSFVCYAFDFNSTNKMARVSITKIYIQNPECPILAFIHNSEKHKERLMCKVKVWGMAVWLFHLAVSYYFGYLSIMSRM